MLEYTKKYSEVYSLNKSNEFDIAPPQINYSIKNVLNVMLC